MTPAPGKCDECGRDVVWARTKRNNRPIPLDPTPVVGGTTRLDRNPSGGDLPPLASVVPPLLRTAPLYTVHLGTCPERTKTPRRRVHVRPTTPSATFYIARIEKVAAEEQAERLAGAFLERVSQLGGKRLTATELRAKYWDDFARDHAPIPAVIKTLIWTAITRRLYPETVAAAEKAEAARLASIHFQPRP